MRSPGPATTSPSWSLKTGKGSRGMPTLTAPRPAPGRFAWCSAAPGWRSRPWWRRMSSRSWPRPRESRARSCCWPFQVSVLGTPSPAVTPTNLLYNVVAAPGALLRYRRRGRPVAAWPWCCRRNPAGRDHRGGPSGEVLPGPGVSTWSWPPSCFRLGGGWSLSGCRHRRGRRPVRTTRSPSWSRRRCGAAVGGIYGIGGGSILAPILVGTGRPSRKSRRPRSPRPS